MTKRVGRLGLVCLVIGLLVGCGTVTELPVGSAPLTARPPASPASPPTVLPTATNGSAVPPRSTWPVGSGAGPAPGPTGQPRERRAELGQPVILRLGEVASFTDGLRVEARAVTEDSRCPVNVTCVWMGRAVIALVVSRAGQVAEARTLATLHSSERTDRLTYAGYELRLAGVMPRPASPEQPVRREDYQIELVVTR